MLKKDLFDTSASLYVLSSLMHKPLLLQDERYVFCKTDFYKPLQQMVFYAIFNMAQNGVEHIVPTDIDLHLSQYSSQYEFYKREKGFEFVTQCYQSTEGSDENQFKYYYNRLKKFSILRDLEGLGIDTTPLYDTNKDALNRDLEDEKINRMSCGEILDYFRNGIVEIENRHIGKDEGGSQIASEGMRKLVEDLRNNPEVGLPLDGEIMNYATRGARLGKLYTYSAPSGQGKTRFMVGNACAISMPYIDKSGKVIFRGTVDSDDYQKVLYVATEQKPDEIQTMILAYVSGVNEKTILLGNYTDEEFDRIQKALEIIDKYGSNLILEVIPDPSIAMVKARLAKYIVQDNIEYIFYDYIFTSPGLTTEFSAANLREDVVLMMLSNTIKEVAMSYNVFIQSATQLNDGWSKQETGLRDQNCIRGSKAIADKIDIGMIGVKIRDEEKQQIEAIWTELRKTNPEKYKHEPNIVIDIYKNRRGELNGVKIYRYFDYSTCHCEDLFVTDSGYKTVSDIGTLQYEKRPFDFLDLKTRGKI